MEHDDSTSQDSPLKTSSVSFSVKISNSKKKNKSSKSDHASILTIGNSLPKPREGKASTIDLRQCDDSGDAISSVSADIYLDDTFNLKTSKVKREKAPAVTDEQLNETYDELEALGFALETTKETAVPYMEHSLSPPKAASTDFSNSLSNDFSPVNILTSFIPEIYHERYPKPIDTTGKYVCKWCKPKTRTDINKYIYKEVYRLIQHYLKYHKDIPLEDYGIQCQHCSASFFHEKRLESHLCHELHKPRRNLALKRLTKDILMKRCLFCDKIFLSEKRYLMHLQSNGCKFKDMKLPVSDLGAFDHIKCKFCEDTFLLEQDYQAHMTPRQIPSVFAKTMGVFKCKKVSLQYFECPICLGKYKSEIIFLQHIHHDHTIEEFKYRCDRCKKPFRLEVNYKQHVLNMSNYPTCIDFDACRTIPIKNDGEKGIYRINRERGTTLYPCPDTSCLSVFICTSDLHYHMRKDHNFTPQWRCDKCQMTFLTEIEYEDHITKWQCPFCQEPKIFSLRRELVDHCSQKHRNADHDEKIKCNVCKLNCLNEESLQTHQLKHHGNFDNILKVCPFCGVTDERVNLYRHIKSFHAYLAPTEKLFSCNLCGDKSSFLNKQSLQRHIECVHKKTETSECDVCHKKFAQKATMMRHRRIHLDIKPFKCDICDLSFTQKTGMRSHKERHYNKDGTLKSSEEIKVQVEIIKEQREKQNAQAKLPSKKSSKTRVKTISVPIGDQQRENGSKQAEKVRKSDKSDDNFTSPKSKKSRRINCNMCGSLFADVHKLNFHNCKIDKDYNASGETSKVDEKTIENEPSDDFMYEHKCNKCLKDFISEKRLITHRCLSNYRKVLRSSNKSENSGLEYRF